MNELVNFEIAKLLKEKGFDGKTLMIYNTYGELSNVHFSVLYSAPTIAEVVMWLYEKHGVWIKIGLYVHLGNVSKFQFTIETQKHKSINSIVQLNTNPYKSPTEAYSSAIEYTLNNLL